MTPKASLMHTNTQKHNFINFITRMTMWRMQYSSTVSLDKNTLGSTSYVVTAGIYSGKKLKMEKIC